MRTVSRPASPSTPSYRERIDASAESEGMAIDTLYADYMDEPAPESQRQVLLGQARTAEALGIEQERVPTYCRYAAVAAWLRICDGDPTYNFKAYWANDTDRLRQAARRLQRAELLKHLQRQPGARLIGLADAARLTGASERTLQRACAIGNLPAQKQAGRPGRASYVVRIADLRQLLAGKLAGRAVAA